MLPQNCTAKLDNTLTMGLNISWHIYSEHIYRNGIIWIPHLPVRTHTILNKYLRKIYVSNNNVCAIFEFPFQNKHRKGKFKKIELYMYMYWGSIQCMYNVKRISLSICQINRKYLHTQQVKVSLDYFIYFIKRKS